MKRVNNRQYNKIILVIGIIVVVAALLYMFTLTQANRRLVSKNADLQTEVTAVKRDNQAIKENKVQKYSAKNLTLASTSSVANINTFLKTSFEWDFTNWSTRQERAQKYATPSVVKKMIGNLNMQSKSTQSYIKFLKKDNVYQKINSKHVYVENSDGQKINGIATVNSSLIDGNKTTSHQIQWYHFTYDVQKHQVIQITPVSVN
ncbi:hypothetical protein AZI11_13405 (plasmid) [Levilactobacillus brevis]|uniref:hypothetical protein n=1 Tax=Levilactobacillus brevis TaxID=1580 RepID=UPI000A202F96|nr:hypothetical protein [Levilactobacillus brevis]ARN93928.1 hypothetical protein AZI11_13405 [Levilactobacillus brevis]ARN96529.1 hypothetical protein AZI12_13630 [Levilactobacillus brevis]